MRESAFDIWFREQHGDRPVEHGQPERNLRKHAEIGRNAQALLDATEAWDRRRESALYAWHRAPSQDARNISDKSKNLSAMRKMVS